MKVQVEVVVSLLLASGCYKVLSFSIYSPNNNRKDITTSSSLQLLRPLGLAENGNLVITSFSSFLDDEEADDDILNPTASSGSISNINNNNNNNNMQDDEYWLSYLPENGRLIPPLLKQLIIRITKQYVFGTTTTTNNSLDEIGDIIEIEHRSRDVPVQIGKDVVIDVTKTGLVHDEIIAEILSIGALYKLPKDITYILLSSAYNDNTKISSLKECQNAFNKIGWDGVTFPKGLAVRPKSKYRIDSIIEDEKQKQTTKFWFLHRNKTLRKEAEKAVVEASKIKPPSKMQDRKEFLKTIDEQLILSSTEQQQPDESLISSLSSAASYSTVNGDSVTTTTTTTTTHNSNNNPIQRMMMFFPSDEKDRLKFIRQLKRITSRKYNVLKQKGHAGLIAYCFFNFLYYTIGFIWQWPRIVTADPLTTNLSIKVILTRKFAKIFAYLYALSQLIKLPKLFISVSLIPISEKILQYVQKRTTMKFTNIKKETIATAITIIIMYLSWMTITAFPIITEYTKLRRILYLDEHIIQVYGLQPV